MKRGFSLAVFLASLIIYASLMLVVNQIPAEAQFIPGLNSWPTNQASRPLTQTQGIIYQGDSVIVSNFGNVYNEESWGLIDRYASSGYDIKESVDSVSSIQNGTLKIDRLHFILEKLLE